MKKMIIAILAVIILGTTTCFAGTKIDWDNNVITAKGIGVTPTYATTSGQAQALARRAAIVDAYRNLAEVIYGVEVDSDTTIEQLAIKKDTVRTNVSGLIKNARIIDEEIISNGDYQVTLAVRVFGEQNSVAAAVWKDKEPAVPTLQPSNPSIISTIDGDITGIVIDCRGLNLDRIMAPNIIDEDNRNIYRPCNVDSDYIVKNGLVDYAKTDNKDELSRAGNNPLIIKATRLEHFNAYPVVSKEDGDKILAANSKNNFLKKCPVVFIQ